MPGNRKAVNSHRKRDLKTKLFGGRLYKPCCFCRRELTRSVATIEHVLPISLGGSWSIDNLRLSCSPCNSERDVTDFEEFRRKKRGQVS